MFKENVCFNQLTVNTVKIAVWPIAFKYRILFKNKKKNKKLERNEERENTETKITKKKLKKL